MYLGEEILILDWFRLHYIENNGMKLWNRVRWGIWEINPYTIQNLCGYLGCFLCT